MVKQRRLTCERESFNLIIMHNKLAVDSERVQRDQRVKAFMKGVGEEKKRWASLTDL